MNYYRLKYTSEDSSLPDMLPADDGNWVRREDHETEVAKLRDMVQTDGPVYQAGRDEGRADVTVQLRAILDPDDLFHWNLDGVLKKVARLAAPGYCSAMMVEDLRARAEKAEAEVHKSWDLAVSSARKHNAARNELARLRAQQEAHSEDNNRSSGLVHRKMYDQVCAEREKFQKALITIERSGVPGAIIVAARTDDHACGWCRGMATPCPVEVARIALAWCGKEEK